MSLSSHNKSEIQRLYLKGLKPAEICAELQHLKLKPASIRQFLWRAGLTEQRGAIDEAKKQSVVEILAKARQEHADVFADVLDDSIAGLKNDSANLRDGWALVEDAAGASSLMRAKALFLDRTLRAFGVDNPTLGPDSAARGLNLFVFTAPALHTDPADLAKPVEPTPLTTSEAIHNSDGR